jgi:hypothetical protein
MRSAGLVALVATISLSGCDRGFYTQPATGRAALALAVAARAGSDAVFDRADAVQIKLGASGGAVLLDTTLSLAAGSERRVSLAIAREDLLGQALTLRLDLIAGGSVVFRDCAPVSVTLAKNETTSATPELCPIAAGITATGVEVNAIGSTVQLQGAVLFATGDTLTAGALTWSTLDPQAVSVTQQGALTTISNGTARIVAVHDAFADTVLVTVLQLASTVSVSPSAPSLNVGDTLRFLATARDANGNVVSHAASWSSGSASVLSINSTGLATAVSAGTSLVTATVDGASGSTTTTITAVPRLTVSGAGTGSGSVSSSPSGIISCSITAGVAGSPTCSATIAGGGSVTLTATAASGSTFTGWSGACSGTGSCVVSMTQDRAVTATFGGIPLASVTTTAATLVGPGSARLNSSVNGNGVNYTPTWLYGTNSQLTMGTGNRTCTGAAVSGASASSTVSLNCMLGGSGQGLYGSTTYFFRGSATNAGGTANGSILSFTTSAPTAPTVTADSASQVTTSTARVHGTPTPNGSDFFIWFEYSFSPTMSNPIVSGSTSAFATDGAGVWTGDISFLSPSTTVYYRWNVSTALGMATSTIRSFTTPSSSPPMSGALRAGSDSTRPPPPRPGGGR